MEKLFIFLRHPWYIFHSKLHFNLLLNRRVRVDAASGRKLINARVLLFFLHPKLFIGGSSRVMKHKCISLLAYELEYKQSSSFLIWFQWRASPSHAIWNSFLKEIHPWTSIAMEMKLLNVTLLRPSAILFINTLSWFE